MRNLLKYLYTIYTIFIYICFFIYNEHGFPAKKLAF